MSTDRGGRDQTPPPLDLPDDAVLLFNRALVIMHSVRTAVHELNNIFQMVSGSVELLQNNPALAPALRPRVDAILRQSHRGEALVRGVADLTRRDSPGPQSINLEDALEHALEARRFEHRRSGIAISRVSATPGPWAIRADPQDLQQLLLSLLIGAEHAIGQRMDGSIALELRRSGPSIELSITDNGSHTDAPGNGALSSEIGWNAAQMLAARLGGAARMADDRQTTYLSLPAFDRPA